VKRFGAHGEKNFSGYRTCPHDFLSDYVFGTVQRFIGSSLSWLRLASVRKQENRKTKKKKQKQKQKKKKKTKKQNKTRQNTKKKKGIKEKCTVTDQIPRCEKATKTASLGFTPMRVLL